ncbi:MAG: putative Zn finger protein [Lentisphaeria bacterium]|jgi:uncharacterized Zn finger protein
MSYDRWPPYVPVAKRRANSALKLDKLRKKGLSVQPIEIEGSKIAKSFWGAAWCKHLENFSDFENRLPRGRTYVRNGSVCHLDIKKGAATAIVSGSSLYNVSVSVKPLEKKQWQGVKQKCTGQITSMLDLLRGSLSDGVMKVVTDEKNGLFPKSKELEFTCNCPDWASMCKHIAATLYGIGARLDNAPELLFLLRGVDHNELVDATIDVPLTTGTRRSVKGDLASVFAIDLDEGVPSTEIERPIKKATNKNIGVKAKKPTKVKKINGPVRLKSLKNVDASQKVREESKSKKQTQDKTKSKRPFSISAKGVVRMRKKFGMNYSECAALLGVSPGAVKNWEAKEGKLNLRPESLQALEKVAGLDRAEAHSLIQL